jgi:hypothetical protein
MISVLALPNDSDAAAVDCDSHPGIDRTVRIGRSFAVDVVLAYCENAGLALSP